MHKPIHDWVTIKGRWHWANISLYVVSPFHYRCTRCRYEILPGVALPHPQNEECKQNAA